MPEFFLPFGSVCKRRPFIDLELLRRYGGWSGSLKGLNQASCLSQLGASGF